MIALIYKTIDYKQNDKLIYLLSNSGKYQAILKDGNKIKKTLMKKSEILNIVDIDIDNKKLKTIYDINLVKSYDDLKYDYFKLKNIYYIFDLIDRYILDDSLINTKILYEWLITYLDMSVNFIDSTNAFLLKFLSLLGYLPKFYDINLPNFGFSFEKLKLDNIKYDIPYEICKIFHMLIYSKFSDLNINNLNIRKYIIMYYSNVIDFTFKGEKNEKNR